MLDPKNTFSYLQKNGIEFFAGVPDSLLKDICAYITDNTSASNHVITANEGAAVGAAVGHYLATSKPALVYMQNSGIGNAINPLLSLADKDVYSIPMVLMIGWRGEPGVKDEPQHVKQGRVMKAMLESMEIPYEVLPVEENAAEQTIAASISKCQELSQPVALLVRGDTFSEYKIKNAKLFTNYEMNREEAIKEILKLLDQNTVIISTTGKTSREIYELRVANAQGQEKDFLTVGSMGHASQIALGIANASPKSKVLCLDGDGAVLMHMGSLAISGNSQLKNLYHIVVNNGAHDSVGGQPTVGFDVSLTGVAKSCNYKVLEPVSTRDDLKKQFAELMRMDGPVFLEIKVNKGARSNLGRPKSTPIENKRTFMQFLGVQR